MSSKLAAEHPECAKIQDEARELWRIRDKGGKLDAAQQERLEQLSAQLVPYSDEYAARCFVTHDEDDKEILLLGGAQDLSDLLFEIRNPKETQELLTLLAILANPSPDGTIDTVGLMLAKAFHIPLADDLTVENMTAQQAVALFAALTDRTGADG